MDVDFASRPVTMRRLAVRFRGVATDPFAAAASPRTIVDPFGDGDAVDAPLLLLLLLLPLLVLRLVLGLIGAALIAEAAAAMVGMGTGNELRYALAPTLLVRMPAGLAELEPRTHDCPREIWCCGACVVTVSGSMKAADSVEGQGLRTVDGFAMLSVLRCTGASSPRTEEVTGSCMKP